MSTQNRFLSGKFACGMIVAVSTLFSGAVGAASLHLQAPLNKGVGLVSDAFTGQQVADDFSVASSFNVEKITWWGSYYDSGWDASLVDDFVVRLYSDINGAPTQEYSANSVTKTVTALTDNLDSSVYEFSLDLSGAPLSLGAGGYYLFVQAQSSPWSWLTSSPVNGSQTRQDEFSTWQPYQADLAFGIDGSRLQTVPEPNSLALMMLAGGMIGLSRKLNRD